jgi:NADPH:quinone reductase-like Zn-dependent oxidoreductase
MDIIDQLGCTLDGMLSEYALLDENWLVDIPEHLSWEEAATLPCAALTAWSALTNSHPILPGKFVLTIGSGGVPLFAIQFSKLFGAKIIALTSRDEKIERLKALGADYVLNYRSNSEWSSAVLELTSGKGVDLVIETGGTDTLMQSVHATAFGGEIALVNFMGTINTKTDWDLKKILTPLFVRLITLRPLFVGSRLSFEDMNRAISLHKLHPVIEHAFSFDEVRDAYNYFSKGEHMGKVIIAGK